MLFLDTILVLTLIIGLVWFVNPKLSPIPYFPTLESDMARIKKSLQLSKGSVLYDLGAGDGKIVFRFASSTVKTVAIETNPYLVTLMYFKRLFHPYKKQITILCQNLFKTDLSKATHIYLFVGPYFINEIDDYIKSQPREHNLRVISYRYAPKKRSLKVIDQYKPAIYWWQLKKTGNILYRN